MRPAETRYKKTVRADVSPVPSSGLRVLKAASGNSKVQGRVQRGPLAGSPIYTYTKEERKTCPKDCDMWAECYGDRMPWALRLPWDRHALRLDCELLAARHPDGFLVRAYVLGDFETVGEVGTWEKLLNEFPMMSVYGYSHRTGKIGAALDRAAWDRFVILDSTGTSDKRSPCDVFEDWGDVPGGWTKCPEQTGAVGSCAECGLCFTPRKFKLAFLKAQNKRNQ